MAKFLGRLAPEQLKDKKEAQQQLLSWKPRHDFLTCFDVDGHLLDNMTSKQMIVFQPNFMDIYGLREIETFYRLHAEAHNLWTENRGCDRHEAKNRGEDDEGHGPAADRPRARRPNHQAEEEDRPRAMLARDRRSERLAERASGPGGAVCVRDR